MHTEYVCYPVTIIMHLRNVYSLHGGGFIIRFFRYHILHIRVSPHIQDSTYVVALSSFSSSSYVHIIFLKTLLFFQKVYVHTLLSFSSLLLSFLLSSGPSETGGLAPSKNQTVVAVHYIKIPQGGKGTERDE